MNVLLVAYACEPGKGSEPGIGWDWATGLARDSRLSVTVVTRANNRAAIEAAISEIPDTAWPAFEYWDLPPALVRLKRGRAAIYPYYAAWCLGVRPRLRRLVCERGIDILHHLTFSTDWLPGSLPARPGCATVLGPLGGYDTSPEMAAYADKRFLALDRRKKRVRAAGLFLRRAELSRCDALIANNAGFAETYRRLAGPRDIHCLSTQLSAPPQPRIPSREAQAGVRPDRLFLIAGRIVYWKGHDAALAALALCRERGHPFRAIVVGTGEAGYASALQARARHLGLADRIEFRPQMDRADFLSLLARADAFLYPTFYGTADSIMMEAVERRIPVVCFPSSGAQELLGESYPHMTADFSAAGLADRLMAANKASPDNLAASEALAHRHAPETKLAAVADIYRRTLDAYGAAR